MYRRGPGCPGSREDSQLPPEGRAGKEVSHIRIPHDGDGACFSLADMAPGNNDGFGRSTTKPAPRCVNLIPAQLVFLVFLIAHDNLAEAG